MTKSKDIRSLTDLGAASRATLGAKGTSTDLVREIPSSAGISDE